MKRRPDDPRGAYRRASSDWGDDIGYDVANDAAGMPPAEPRPLRKKGKQVEVKAFREYLATFDDGTQAVIRPLNDTLWLGVPGFDGRVVRKVER